MNILTDKYFSEYSELLKTDMEAAVNAIGVIESTPHNFTFYTSVAVISSSRIEGEQMELDSYLKHKMQDIEYLPELVEKPNDLYRAYIFAQGKSLNRENFMQAHVLLSEHLLPEKWRGVYRKNEMLVMEHNTGRVQFEAAPYSIVAREMDKLWEDIEALKAETLTIAQLFYYASFMHLAFVNIHPFNDGNGRAGRLLEKWFLAERLGEKTWYIRSEQYHYQNVNDYYKNLNRLGLFYEALDYGNAQSFLQMLPMAVCP